MPDAANPEKAAGDEAASQPATPAESQDATAMEEAQKEAAAEREEDGGYQ